MRPARTSPARVNCIRESLLTMSTHAPVDSSGAGRTIDQMSPRSTSAFFCQECGHEAVAWSGGCAGCGGWNTMVEAPKPEPVVAKGGAKRGGGARAAGKPVALRDVSAPQVARLQTGIEELDRVLGGGLVPG